MKRFNVNFQIDKVLELWQILSEKGYLCFDKITNVKIASCIIQSVESK